jgi:hypothetical protein
MSGAEIVDDVSVAGVKEEDRAGHWEHPHLIFFVKKNHGAEMELLVSSAWRRDDHGVDTGERPSLRSKRERERSGGGAAR